MKEGSKKRLISKARFQGSLRELGRAVLDFRPSFSWPVATGTSPGLQRGAPNIARVRMQSEGEILLPTLASFPSSKMIFLIR